jgi:capsular polysaccharide biosynthesis protein
MVMDLPTAAFAQLTDAGELTGIEFPALKSRFLMFRFKECWLDMDQLFPIAPGGQTCKALFRTYLDHKYQKYFTQQFTDHLGAHRNVDYEGVFVLGGSDNYWHFMVDHLAKLPLLRYFTDGERLPILVSQQLPDELMTLIRDACAFLQVGSPTLVPDSRPILKLRQAFVPCVNDIDPRLHFLRQFGRSLQPMDGAGPQRILFRRGDVMQRCILNEAELEERLGREHGFVAVDTGAMTIYDQIRLVRNARIAIGGHGAALTNMIFAPPDATVIELYALQKQAFFKSVCDVLKIAHRFLEGTPVAEQIPSDPNARFDNVDYTIDIQAALGAVKSIVG